MLLADVLFLAIVVYLGYRFIFNFVLPILRTTHHVRKQFQHMRDTGAPGPGPSNNGQATEKRTHKPPADDYIDFEEVKK
jgi:hypothetical protein